MRGLNRIYVRALLLLAVLGPLAWLLVTDEGQRYGDILVLKLSGSPTLTLRYQALGPNLREGDWLHNYGEVAFQCSDQASDFGDRLCYSPLAAFNGTPAQYLTAFFHEGHLTALKLAYQRSYHGHLYSELTQQLGAPQAVLNDGGPQSGFARWQAGSGMVYAFAETLPKEGEPTLLWLAAAP